jgi:predicted outer membrane protein
MRRHRRISTRPTPRAVKLFESYAELGDNPALKQFAANTLSLIKQHLEQAKKLMP